MRTGMNENELSNGIIGAAIEVHRTLGPGLIEQAYEEAGLGPEDVQVIELHDCFSAMELLTYETLGLCEPGKAGTLVDEGATTYGGRWVVNPSGGLIGLGHPVGATGVRMLLDAHKQVTGTAGDYQVEGATLLGLADAALYRAKGAGRGRWELARSG